MLVARFCLECWCKRHKIIDFPENYAITGESVLCDKCGNWTNIIIEEQNEPFLHRVFHRFFPNRAVPHNEKRKK